jgi:TonB family protein
MRTTQLRSTLVRSATCGAAIIAVLMVLPFASATAKWVEKDRPDFPIGVYYSGIQGSVVVSLTMDKSGRVTSSTVMRSSGHASLDQLAREATMHWRLHPDSVLSTDLTVGRLELIKFKQPQANYSKSLIAGAAPYWAQVFP